MYHKHHTGRLGEQLAAQYLQNHGYEILDTNVFLRYTEIDIIARREDTIHFFEVKTRRNTRHGTPVEAVSYKKIGQLQRAGRWYVNRYNVSYRALAIGVVGILYKGKGMQPDVTCIPNVVLP